jgi:FAD:protein FMN transferase
MPSSTVPAARERARPLLGTIVRIRVADGPSADAAIDAAFAEIAAIHRLMSFQEAGSDLGSIGRATPGVPVAIEPRTWACIARALAWSERSGGAFDPVAAVSAGATWRDVSIDEEGLRVARPLRIDLSGIGKGYAVDRACAVLGDRGVASAIIEAGGDLRVFGDQEEEVALRPSAPAEPAMIVIADGALASSDPALAESQAGEAVHVDGRDRTPLPRHFVAVAAPECADADALTKIVLALRDGAAPLLAQAGATSYRFDGAAWSMMGAT